MFKWATREVPEGLRPAKGLVNALILSALAWAVIVALILMIAPACFGEDNPSQPPLNLRGGEYAWTKTDTAREVVWMALHAVDWGQTLEIARNPRDYSEMNPVLGDHPSVGKVNLYMGAWAVAHPLVSYLLPRTWRDTWQYLTIGVSFTCTANNFNLGLKVKF